MTSFIQKWIPDIFWQLLCDFGGKIREKVRTRRFWPSLGSKRTNIYTHTYTYKKSHLLSEQL